MSSEPTGIPPLAQRIRGFFTAKAPQESAYEQLLRQQDRSLERARIARELHDTLLQGLLSATMQLQIAEGWLPTNSPAKPVLIRAGNLMRKGIAEGRAALEGLRFAEAPITSLEHALLDLHQELAPADRDRLHIAKMGRPKPVDPAVLQQVLMIAREALLNAMRHSQATRIAVEIRYSPRKLRITVRDNGTGLDPQLLRSPRKSHYGLTGMRERASTIGAQLRICTKPATGTEVTLSLPALK